jgi:Domain of unknown function (DUF4350)
MPSALGPGDRKLLLIAGGILLLLIAATVALAPSESEGEGSGAPTSYSTTKSGAQAAYLLLGELGYNTERWERSPTELPSEPAGTVLILASPSSFPRKDEREALLRFASAGGWIIYAGNFPFAFLETGAVEPAPITPESLLPTQTFPAIAPSPFTLGASKVAMNAGNRWVSSDGAQVPLYGVPEAPVVVTWRLATGRILWWAAPTPVTNSGISQEENLPFFLSSIQAVRPGAPAGQTTVLWDEYFHGYRGSLWGYFQKTPVPWALYQLAFIALFVLLAFSRRSGPQYPPVVVSRLSPLEFVDTLGDLYRRAHASPAAVRVAYQRFRTQLVRRLALAHSVSNRQLDAAVRERLHWKQPGLMDTLQRADQAVRHTEMPDAEALHLVQALEHYEVLLGLKQRPNKEKR